jgi:putative oxidoreductase
MTVFTGYVILVLINFFGRVPCSCGGVIQVLGWKTHMVFNLFFLLLTGLGILIITKKRRVTGKEK